MTRLKEKVPLWADGLLLSSLVPISNYVTQSIANYTLPKDAMIGCLATGGLIAVYDLLTKESKLEKDIQEILGEGVRILKKKNQHYGYDLIFNILPGMSLKNYESKKEALEQYLNAKIQLEYRDKRIVAIVENNNLDKLFNLENEIKNIKYNPTSFYIGNSLTEQTYWDYKKYPHLLIGGGTGSGKTTGLLNLITMMHKFRKKGTIELYLNDFKGADLSLFKNSSYVKRYAKTKEEFKESLLEIEKISKERFELFNKNNVRDIFKYNEKFSKKLSEIFVVIDEIAQLEGENKIRKGEEGLLIKLQKRCALDRACGIHYIIATQTPRATIITGVLKANMEARLAYKTFNDLDSNILFDEKGPEELRGNGEALFKTNKIEKIQCPYVSEDFVESFMEQYNKKPELPKPSNIIKPIEAPKPRKQKGVVNIGHS